MSMRWLVEGARGVIWPVSGRVRCLPCSFYRPPRGGERLGGILAESRPIKSGKFSHNGKTQGESGCGNFVMAPSGQKEFARRVKSFIANPRYRRAAEPLLKGVLKAAGRQAADDLEVCQSNAPA